MDRPIIDPNTATIVCAEMTTAFYTAKLVQLKLHLSNPDFPVPSDAEIIQDVKTTFRRLLEHLPQS